MDVANWSSRVDTLNPDRVDVWMRFEIRKWIEEEQIGEVGPVANTTCTVSIDEGNDESFSVVCGENATLVADGRIDLGDRLPDASVGTRDVVEIVTPLVGPVRSTRDERWGESSRLGSTLDRSRLSNEVAASNEAG